MSKEKAFLFIGGPLDGKTVQVLNSSWNTYYMESMGEFDPERFDLDIPSPISPDAVRHVYHKMMMPAEYYVPQKDIQYVFVHEKLTMFGVMRALLSWYAKKPDEIFLTNGE